MHIRLQITLLDVKPQVARTILVPGETSLDNLHLLIQSAMGWSNIHDYEFRSEELSWVCSYSATGSYGETISESITLNEILPVWRTGAVTYTYNFKDHWVHSIQVFNSVDTLPESRISFLLDGTGLCPPENSGGPTGLERTCKIVRQEHKHPRRKDFMTFMLFRHDQEYTSLVVANQAAQLARTSAMIWDYENILESDEQTPLAGIFKH
jgi:hypothetical protein